MTNNKKSPTSALEKVLPSQFMRELRPEYYSDTEDRVSYILDALRLEYYLESITQRNQTHDFEIFCRKLCERTICPNLRSHTGPDGGGDSKVDTETYPVSEKISILFYVGDQKSSDERWAFAISAQEDWKSKVRDDVKKIYETNRGYKRIIFVTSRFARDKDRADIEDDLSKQYDIPVTIHDRSWIVQEVIEKDRKDLAFNYLGIGETKTDPLRLGPTDYSRTQQLADIEKSIEDPDVFRGMERERVTEALVAAKLSRNLERPRFETDGRFLRAIRLAGADGTDRQKLKAKYEHIWTAFWWFDDFQFLKNNYDSFENLVLKSEDAIDLELLCNLLQLFFNCVFHEHMSREECRIDERIERLKLALEKIISNKNRPNNSLEAQTSLLIIQMNQAMQNEKRDGLSDIWKGFSQIFEKAGGLGEFNVDRLIGMVEIAGDFAGNDPAYNTLIEEMADFVSGRKSEAEGALILLKRAQKLDFESNLEMIRLLGKATVRLAKKEYRDELVEALQLLMFAYRSAGLLWAARASCTFLTATLALEGDERSKLPIRFVPTMKTWGWLALELRHIPDLLFAIQLLNGILATLPLAEESKTKVSEDIRELDLALGCLFLNADEDDIQKLETAPDVLEALGLFSARSALLYIMGYNDILRADGSFPESEPDEEINRTFSLLASQPIAESLRGRFVLNIEEPHSLETSILGMTIEIEVEGSEQSIILAQAILGSLEAFFATTLEKISPHTERLILQLMENEQISAPSVEIDPMEMNGYIYWPRMLSSTNYEDQSRFTSFLTVIAGHVLTVCCMTENTEALLEKLYADEAVYNRITMIAHASNSYHRVTSKNVSKISDWQSVIKKSYKPCIIRPEIEFITIKSDDIDNITVNPGGMPPRLKDHRAISVRSVIDIHSWDRADWKGAGYAQFNPMHPPYMALLFKNADAARKIFTRWKKRFGNHDKDEEISLSIIRQMPQHNKHHYRVLITSKFPHKDTFKPIQLVTMGRKSMLMEPKNDINLERFLESYHHFNAFFLLPAILKEAGPPEFLFDLAILKHNLSVKLASEIKENDIEFMAMHI
ncbi:tetratricopeptide repeat protein [Runella aurantiaca]|uniref:Tetratricopeptide repeat protein n=2 Tax=Runella aurantiaca TaxID=2282308 RepID=A0A369II15_9BACT|nr:tetratricopeptide repeat protein [Runella aurantiaca]